MREWRTALAAKHGRIIEKRLCSLRGIVRGEGGGRKSVSHSFCEATQSSVNGRVLFAMSYFRSCFTYL